MISTSESVNGTPAGGDALVNRVQQLRLNNQLGAAKKGGGGSWLPWVLCAMLAFTWAGVGVRWYRAVPGTKGEETPGASAGTPRSASGGAPQAVAAGEIVFQLKGNLIPALQIAVSPIDVGGEVTGIFFKEGDSVRKGQPLATLRDNRYENERKTADASLKAAEARLAELLPESVRQIEKDQAKAEWSEAEASRVRADQEFRRVTDLKSRGVGIGQSEVEKAEADLLGAKARVDRLDKALKMLIEGPRKEKITAARADVEVARSRLAEAERMVANCKIQAPIDGMILTKKSDVGSLVSPASFNVSASLCEIANLAQLEVEVDVPERNILKVRPGQECVLTPEADPSKTYRGFVDRVMPIADDSKNVIKVRVRVILPKGQGGAKDEVPGAFLKPKMSVNVNAYNRDFVPNAKTDQEWK
ncbi:MAG TPA: efflux RND transporter periplasmic adaptor subunit [Gemmataceae bacterium]|nr:efflux RND transporter periplasmic adaptor subunit [Gemmataceae bacterium]